MNAFSKTAVETHVLRLAESRRSRSTESMFYSCICSSVFSGSSLFFEFFSKRRDFETYQDCLYIDSLAQSDTATNDLASPPSFAAPIAGRWLLASLHVSYKTFCHSISSRLATDHVPYVCWSIFPRSSTDEVSNSSPCHALDWCGLRRSGTQSLILPAVDRFFCFHEADTSFKADVICISICIFLAVLIL